MTNQRRRADLRVRSLFQAWQLIGSSRKLWYAMANQMVETDQEAAEITVKSRKTEVRKCYKEEVEKGQ